jgi:hypothetical protein
MASFENRTFSGNELDVKRTGIFLIKPGRKKAWGQSFGGGISDEKCRYFKFPLCRFSLDFFLRW